MLNKVILMGHLVADPELRQTQSGIPCCRFRIAVNRPHRKDAVEQTDFIGCTAWRQTAEFVARYFSKGKLIVVEGQLRNDNYTDNNGVKHYGMDVLTDQVYFAGAKEDGSSSEQRARTSRQTAAQPALLPGDLGDFEEILSDGPPPF